MDRHKMARVHEDHLADLLGGRRTRGSGSQWHDVADGRNHGLIDPFPLAWDGKSTLNGSLSLTRTMWRKISEEAQGEIPMIAVRFYRNERLDVETDLVVLPADDFAEILMAAREFKKKES